MGIQSMKLPEYRPVPMSKDYHPGGDCYCKKPLASGRIYNGWEACRICDRLPRHARADIRGPHFENVG